MKNRKIVLFVSVLSAMLCYGQYNGQSGSKIIDQLDTVPQETVYLHYNESLLFSGETLKYKLYCFDNTRKRFSSISKIGYVSLIAKGGQSVFDHKIRLDSGLGYGDFFVPTSIPTGSYKLVGYSEWMTNVGVELYFQSDIYIVNPYEVLSESHIERKVDLLVEPKKIIKNIAVNQNPKKGKDAFLKLNLDKKNAGKREKIQIRISAINPVALKGSYSISVQKIDFIRAPSKISAELFFTDFKKRKSNKTISNTTEINLPELRGELISGTVIDQNTKRPVKNKKITLSLPGTNYLFKIATSNDQGRFHFNLGQKYANDKAMIQVLSDDWDQLEIKMDTKKGDYKSLVFGDFTLSAKMKGHVLERSIQNQIENAYQEARPDSILPPNHTLPFYRKFSTVYDLDDYTRFNGIPETIVEVIDQVGVRKLPTGDQVFEVRPEEGLTNNTILPMVFVDGLFIKRHQDFMGFSAKKIKSISFSRDNYLLGTQKFQGVLSFKTIAGDYFENFYTPHITNIDLFKPNSQKKYFAQKYTRSEKAVRTPDFRRQLLWLPNIDLSDSTKAIEFYTSDVVGDYEIVLEGFTSAGNPISIKKKITVR